MVSSIKLQAVEGSAESTLEATLVVVGVGARPNVELFDGQLELAPKPWGGLKVCVLVGGRGLINKT